MSQNKFKIEITAIDTASDVINQVQDNLERVARPINKINEAAKPIKGSLNPIQQLGQGLKNASKNLSEITRSPSINSLGSQLLRLGSNAEAGAAGIATAGAGIATGLTAGIAVLGAGAYAAVKFSDSWGKAGFALDKQSSILGMSTEDLQKWTGAAKIAGITAEEMTGTIAALGQNLRDISRGSNPELSLAANQLGIKTPKFGKAIDVNQGLIDVLEKITKRTEGNPQLRMAALSQFGMQSLAPLTYEKDGIEKLRQYIVELNAVKTPAQIKKAVEFQRGMTAAGITADALKYDVQSSLMNVSTPIVHLFTNTVAAIGNAMTGHPDTQSLNNPLKLGAWASKQSEQGFAKFSTPAEGMAAAVQYIQKLSAGGSNNLASLIPQIYPDRNNATGVKSAMYDTAKSLGVDYNQTLNTNDPKVLTTIISNMIHSAYKGTRLDQDSNTISQGVNQALRVDVHINNAPHGTTATVSQGGQQKPARVHQSMTGIPQ